SPLNYSDANLDDAKSALARLYTALKETKPGHVEVDWDEIHAKRFKEAMNDDFATPEAVAVLFDLANRINAGEKALVPLLRALGGVLGLLQRDAQEFLQGGATESWIAEAIAAREAARKRRDYAEADRIRKDLLDKGIVLEDLGGRTTWRRK